jgi:hypothetical protein
VIAQVESGEVQRIRKLYGPEKGRKAILAWSTLKVTVTRRERVYEQLVGAFKGDKARFFSFFTVGQDPKEEFKSYRKIAEVIPWMKADIKAEQALPHYCDEAGLFQASLWEQQWINKNWQCWEIWRAL